jgi:hypothetical protein
MNDNAAEKERRRAEAAASQAQLKSQLNAAQLHTLGELEHFGWELKFIRRKPFQPPVPVVFDANRERFAVLELDGTLNDNPGFEIRG